MNTDTQVTEEAVVQPSREIAASFNAELEKVGIDPRTGESKASFEDANDVTQNNRGIDKTATELQKEAEKKSEDGIPDEILTGTKAEKIPEVDPFTAEAPQEMKGKSREHFKNLQVQAGQKISAVQAENAKLLAELTELKKNGNYAGEDITKELEELRKSRAELEGELERVAVERSPMFKQKFLSREQSIRAQAVRALKVTGADETLFDQAVAASDKQKFELLNSEELSEGQRSTLSSLMVQYDMIQDEKKQALDSSKEFVKEYQTKQEEAHKAQLAQREAQELQIFDMIGKKVSTEFEPFMEVPGNDAWNEQVKQNIERAKNFFAGKASLEELAEIAHYGIGAKSLHKMFKTVQAKYNALVAENSKLRGANPSVNGQHQIKTPEKAESIEERRMRSFREEMQAVSNQG